MARHPYDKFVQEIFAQNSNLLEIMGEMVNAQKRIMTKQRESTNLLRTALTRLAENEIQNGREFDHLHEALDDLLVKQQHRHAAMAKEMFGGATKDLTPNHPIGSEGDTVQGSSDGFFNDDSKSDSNGDFNAESPITASQVR